MRGIALPTIRFSMDAPCREAEPFIKLDHGIEGHPPHHFGSDTELKHLDTWDSWVLWQMASPER